jgi:hypothetical protein
VEDRLKRDRVGGEVVAVGRGDAVAEPLDAAAEVDRLGEAEGDGVGEEGEGVEEVGLTDAVGADQEGDRR